MFRRVTIFAALSLSFLASGCEQPVDDSAPETDPTFTVRDSAGIEIVENHAPQWSAGEFWTIDPAPEIVLGGAGHLTEAASDPAHLVWLVVGLARLADGRVASIDYFDTGGTLLKERSLDFAQDERPR